MAKKKSHRPPAPRQSTGPSARPRTSRISRRWWLLLLLPLLIWGAMQLRHRAPSARPPAVSTAGFESLIVRQIEDALTTARQQPRLGQAWGRLGMILHAHDLAAEAQECFAQAAQLEPREARWHHLLGLLLAQHSADSAVAQLAQAANLAPDRDNPSRLRLGQVQFETGRHDEAEASFKKLLAANSGHAPARLGLAEIARARNQPTEARTLINACLQNPHTAKRAHTLLAGLLQQFGETAAAQDAVRLATSLPPDRAWPDPHVAEAARHRIGRRLWIADAEKLLAEGRFHEAGPLIAQLVQAYPDAPESWLFLARQHTQRNDCAAAEQALRRHLQLLPQSVTGHNLLGTALLCQERYAAAIAALQNAVRLKPDFGGAYFNLGFAQARHGLGRDAIKSFRLAIRHSPDQVDAYITLADLLNQTGEKEEARILLQKALQLNPADERAKIMLQRIEP